MGLTVGAVGDVVVVEDLDLLHHDARAAEEVRLAEPYSLCGAAKDNRPTFMTTSTPRSSRSAFRSSAPIPMSSHCARPAPQPSMGAKCFNDKFRVAIAMRSTWRVCAERNGMRPALSRWGRVE